MTRRVLVTGSTGIIGTHLCRFLDQAPAFTEVVRFRGDVTLREGVEEFLSSIGRVDAVIHLAAMVSTKEVLENPARSYAVNVGGTINLLNAIVKLPEKPYFFYCSSSHVYRPKDAALQESDPVEPSSLYGRTKLLGELSSRDICENAGMDYCIGRVFSIHDPGQTGDYLRPKMVCKLSEMDKSRPMDLMGADSIRDFLPAESAAKLIVDIVERQVAGVINIASGKKTTVREFVQSLSDDPVEIRHIGPTNALYADISRLKSVLA